MTRSETQDILMSIQAAYPNFNVPDKTVAVNTWGSVLQDFSYSQVSAALTAYIRSDTRGFAPSIGQIINKLQMLFGENDINEMEAWGMALKAIRNSNYHAEEEFEKLPPTVQRTVVSPKQLREWAMQENIDGTWMNVLQSNFMRTYRAEAEKEKEIQKFNPELKCLINKAHSEKICSNSRPKLSVQEEREQAVKNSSGITEKAKRRLDELFGEAKSEVPKC